MFLVDKERTFECDTPNPNFLPSLSLTVNRDSQKTNAWYYPFNFLPSVVPSSPHWPCSSVYHWIPISCLPNAHTNKWLLMEHENKVYYNLLSSIQEIIKETIIIVLVTGNSMWNSFGPLPTKYSTNQRLSFVGLDSKQSSDVLSFSKALQCKVPLLTWWPRYSGNVPFNCNGANCWIQLFSVTLLSCRQGLLSKQFKRIFDEFANFLLINSIAVPLLQQPEWSN